MVARGAVRARSISQRKLERSRVLAPAGVRRGDCQFLLHVPGNGGFPERKDLRCHRSIGADDERIRVVRRRSVPGAAELHVFDDGERDRRAGVIDDSGSERGRIRGQYAIWRFVQLQYRVLSRFAVSQ